MHGAEVIPEAAVEAAAKVFYQDGWEGPPFWESLDADDPSRLEYLTTARAALEAAAPHMLAEAIARDYEKGAGVLGDGIPIYASNLRARAAAIRSK